VTGRLSLRGDPLVDVLGVLTICVYGSWFYGFGVLIDDIGAELGMGATALGASFGAAQALVGLLALVTGRLLDRRGPSIVLGVIGPLGAVALGVSGRVGDSLLFAVLFAIGGGLTGAAGFYTLTQSVIVRADRTRSLERIIRLTIWGALASPIAIPVTELLRSTLGWRLAIEIPAGFAFIAFLASSRGTRSRR
jgi:MFS family permease